MTEKIREVLEDIISIYKDGGSKADASSYIKEVVGLGRTQSQYWAKRVFDEYYSDDNSQDANDEEEENPFNKKEEKELESDLEYSDKYVYNRSDDNYIFLLHESLGKNVVLSGEKVRGLIKTYSNYDSEPATINETALKYRVPRNVLIHVLRILAITHDAIPFTPEVIRDGDEDELVEDCINSKRFTIHQKLQKRDWAETKNDAKQWNEFVAGKLDPISNYLNNWTPPKVKYTSTISSKLSRSLESKSFLSVLTDNHIGELTENAFDGQRYDSSIAIDNIFTYLSKIEKKVKDRNYGFDKCVLVCLGDILNSCLDGTTRKGTKLDNDVINEHLFDLGLDVLVAFVEGLKEIFGKVEVKCTKGNHDGILAYAMYSAVAKYFAHDSNISFEITKKYIDYFKINNNFFLYTHGATDTIKASLPKTKNKIESFVQSLLLRKAQELVNVGGKYILSGHTHSFQHIEYNDFEHIVCSASVNSDEYAEALGYWSRPRQQCFIVGDHYIEETLHIDL